MNLCHDCHSGNFGYLAAFKLCVTSGNYNCGFRIAFGKSAYCLTAFFVGHFRYGACVDHYNVGRFALLYAPDAFFGQQACHSRGFCKIQFAAECMEKGFVPRKCFRICHSKDNFMVAKLHVFYGCIVCIAKICAIFAKSAIERGPFCRCSCYITACLFL